MNSTFKSYTWHVKGQALAISDSRAAYWILSTTLVVSFALYIVFVNQTVRNVVKWRTLESQINSATMNLSQLEFQYISMRNDVTLDKAHALGFSDVASTRYVAMKGAVEVAMNH